MYILQEKRKKKTLNNVKEEASGLYFLVHLIQHNLNLSAAKPNWPCSFMYVFIYMQHIVLHVCMSMRPMVLSMICLIYGLDTLKPLWDLKDKYGAIRPHIGVVTAHDWSCGLINHIILKRCYMLRFSLCYMSVRSVVTAHSPPDRADCHWEKQ